MKDRWIPWETSIHSICFSNCFLHRDIYIGKITSKTVTGVTRYALLVLDLPKFASGEFVWYIKEIMWETSKTVSNDSFKCIIFCMPNRGQFGSVLSIPCSAHASIILSMGIFLGRGALVFWETQHVVRGLFGTKYSRMGQEWLSELLGVFLVDFISRFGWN